MGLLHLHLHPDAYELHLDDALLAHLPGGAASLLAGAGERLSEYDIEVAIERAEEWIMPSTARMQQLALQVHDAGGRLRQALGGGTDFTVAELEQAFDRTHDAVVRGRVADREAVAHVVLLRELAHHGRLSRIVLA